MIFHVEFDIKHEKDPLMIIEIKSEPQDNKFAVKLEAEECENFLEDADIKHEINPISQLDATTLEMGETQENVIKLVEDSEKKSQEDQKNTEDEEINGLLLVDESCEGYGMDLQEQSIFVQIGENVNPFPQFNNFGFCNKDSLDESNYATCMTVHTGEKRYTCNFCTKTLSRKYQFTRHIQTHTSVKLFTCTICMKSFSQKTTLTLHLRTHTNEKPFACTICMKSFSQKSNLAKHIRTHTNEKPFACTICMKSFSQKSTLSSHLRTHTNEKPFACTICMKSFSQKSNLATHIRTHTNEKPFACTICTKSFSQKSNLTKHIRTQMRNHLHVPYV